MSDWFKYDGHDEETELDTQINPHEKAALAAIEALTKLAETQPDKVLVIGAALRKVGTIAQSRAQTLSLRSMTIRRKVTT